MPRRSPSTIPASRRRRSSGRACSRSTARRIGGSATRSRRRSGSTPCEHASPQWSTTRSNACSPPHRAARRGRPQARARGAALRGDDGARARPRGDRATGGARLVRGHRRRGDRRSPRAASRTARAERRSRCFAQRVEAALDRDPATSLVAAAAGEARGLTPRGGRVERGGPAVRRHRDDRGDDRDAFLHLLSPPRTSGRSSRRNRELGANADRGVAAARACGGVIDRYATRECELAGASIVPGRPRDGLPDGSEPRPRDLPDPDRFDIQRPNARLQLAFAQGPHVCLGMHLARLEARTALDLALERLPDLRLDPSQDATVRGLVFRKPDAVHVLGSRRSVA